MLNTDKFATQNKIDLDNALLMSEIEKEANSIFRNPQLLATIVKESQLPADVLPRTNNVNPLSIGIGEKTDEIKKDALMAAVRGLFTGGIPAAITGGAKSYIVDTLSTLYDVNKSQDPIQTLNSLQRWTKAPVESRSGQTPAEIQAQDSSNYTDYVGAGQSQMNKSLQSGWDYYG